MKNWAKGLQDIIWLTQLGLSMILPLIGWLWLCWWLVTSKGAPIWLYLVFIPVGLAAGAESFYHFYRLMVRRQSPKPGEKPPVSFSRHH